MIRFVAGAILGALSASFTYLGTDSPTIAALVGVVVALFVWARGEVLLIAIWED